MKVQIPSRTCDFVIIIILFIIISLTVYSIHGIKIVNDSARYLEYASNLSEGFYLDKHNFWYVGYVFFIFIIQHIFGNDPVWLILSQYLYSLAGIVFLYLTVDVLHGQRGPAILSALMYLLFIEISFWNSYILCESFYLNTICISLYFLLKLYKADRSELILILPALFFITLTSLSKPTGVAMLLSVLLVTLYFLQKQIRLRPPVFVIITLLAFIGSALLLNTMLRTYLVLENYQLGEIVYGVSLVGGYEQLLVRVPEHLSILPETYPPLLRILHFALANFPYWIRLFSMKVFFFLLHIRPFWSITHNLFNLAFLLPLYLFTILGLKGLPRGLSLFFYAFTGIQILSVGLTSVDWDGRFLMPLLPLLFAISSVALHRTFIRVISPEN